VDRYGRGGDHYPFTRPDYRQCGLPSRWRITITSTRRRGRKNGVEYGDLEKYLNFTLWAMWLAIMRKHCGSLALGSGCADECAADGRGDVRREDFPGQPARMRTGQGSRFCGVKPRRPAGASFDLAMSAGETVLKGVSTDNHFFAVRAVGKNGARSIAVPTEMERRPPPLPSPKQ